MKKDQWLKNIISILAIVFLLFSEKEVRVYEKIAVARTRMSALIGQDESSHNGDDFEKFAEQVVSLCTGDTAYFSEIVFTPEEDGYSKGGTKIKSKQVDYRISTVIQDVLMTPADLLTEAIGGELVCNEDNTVITIVTEDTSVTIESGNYIAITNDEILQLEEAPYIESEYMMVPIKDIAGSLGFETYEATEGDVVVTDSFQTKRIIVKSKEEITDPDAIGIADGYDDITILQYETKEEAKKAYVKYEKMEQVDYVQPDRIVSIGKNDEGVTDSVIEGVDTAVAAYHSWGISKMGLDSYQQYLQNHFDYLPEIVVAVVDTGIAYSNSIFAGRILDGGVNYVPSNSGSNGAMDDHGHGTAVSGIIVEATLSNVKILPLKVIDQTGEGPDSIVYLGIMHAIEKGVDVINVSLGGEGKSSLYEEALVKAAAKDISVVVAAGNESGNVENFTPANIEGAITVSSIDYDNKFSSFSNSGKHVDFAAPGENIEVANLNGGFKTTNGTSFSVPHISAAVALIKSVSYYLDENGVYEVLLERATDLGSRGWDRYYGYGLVSLDGFTEVYGNDGNLEFSIEPGYYVGDIQVELIADHSDAKIYYTTDGTEPSEKNGKLYQGAIAVSETTEIRAVAYVNRIYWSKVISGSYVVEELFGTFTVKDGVLTKYVGNLQELTIPEQVDGVTVTKIGEKAFQEARNLKKVEVAGTITEIGDFAFADCFDLEMILIPGTVTSIGEWAFPSGAYLYASKDTAIEQYANENGYRFVKIPVLVGQSRGSFGIHSSQTITLHVEAVGYHLRYQWYENTVNVAEGGTAIAGAVRAEYVPTAHETGSRYYYAKVTGYDNNQEVVLTSDPIKVSTYGVKGDLDGDSEVTVADALLVLRYVSGLEMLDEGQLMVANVDGAEGITAADALAVLRYVAEIIPSLPVEN